MNSEKGPRLFSKYPDLKDKVPWTPILTNVPTPIDRLIELEKKLHLTDGEIYIKRDDKDHDIYGGNKLRKFEFIYADALQKGKKGIMTFGGIGTNHGLAAAIVCQQLGLKCDLFLAKQPLTWHVQRSLLLYKYFGANLHYSKSYTGVALKALFFRLIHPKYYVMLPGGSTLKGLGTPLGTVGFINALYELKAQIDEGIAPEPDVIFLAGGSTGTAAGLIAGCKLAGLKSKVHLIAVSDEIFVNSESITENCNKALDYLQERDSSVPEIHVDEDDFEIMKGYLGSDYGVKTKRGQNAVDLVMDLCGNRLGFKLETTYTGKAMAGLFDFLEEDENKDKTVLFWNTYNSNDLEPYLREMDFNWKDLPRKFHQFYENKQFQCWQLMECPEKTRKSCPAYLNHEYRFWKLDVNCKMSSQKRKKAKNDLQTAINIEDA
ncbi:MAG: 1-aminocyclopropane-1-carboxylate deaminase/D-cysteine desulfhydrase [Promethearchaeia archaeon]